MSGAHQVRFVDRGRRSAMPCAATSFWWVGIDGTLRRYWSLNP